MTPTAEQQAVIEAAKSTSDNLIIHALAGAAKTSTLVLIAKALPTTPILSLAFNVRINQEMKERLPGNCESLTLNSIGHRTWAQAIGRKLVVNKDKTYTIVRRLVDDLPDHDKAEGYEIIADVIKAVGHGKQHGYVPNGAFKQLSPKGLMTDEELFASLPEEPSELMEDLVKVASNQSMVAAFGGDIDYDDQILMPTVFHGVFPSYPLVLADEVQDFSELNHAMLKKIIKKRLIAVGDENQSIYAFRGAHAESMSILQQTFSMRRLDLSVCFRCPQLVVQEARFRAPSMVWPEWAELGTVSHVGPWGIESLPVDCVILCRNNAPLFRQAVRLLKNGRYPELVGSDVGKRIIKVMTKLGPAETPQQAAYELVDEWVEGKEEKARDKAAIYDQAECMKVFIEQGKTLGDAIAYANHILSVSGNIKMMTIHKAKGLEWDNVFILDRNILRMDRGQDKNLLYVAQTRAKKALYYVRTEDFNGV